MSSFKVVCIDPGITPELEVGKIYKVADGQLYLKNGSRGGTAWNLFNLNHQKEITSLEDVNCAVEVIGARFILADTVVDVNE